MGTNPLRSVKRNRSRQCSEVYKSAKSTDTTKKKVVTSTTEVDALLEATKDIAGWGW